MSKIFLAPLPEVDNSKRDLLKAILIRAGVEVNSNFDENQNINSLLDASKKSLSKSDACVLILSKDYGPTVDDSNLVSFSRAIFKAALERSQENGKFKIFIWHHPELLQAEIDIFQQEFINEIRYSLNQNMVFSTVSSPIQFVEDLRSIIEEKEVQNFDVDNTDLFLIFNEVDEDEAQEITDLLSDIIQVEKLNIVQDNDIDYAELCSQQIPQSKLAVVYFKETADWALPFTQQIWKKIGGASSHTPILFIGDEDPSINLGKKFNAPKIISLILSGELIPLEIKVQYDKIAES